MFFEAELSFIRTTFERCHLQTWLLEEEDIRNSALLGVISPIQANTIYKIRDSFMCCYQFLILPDTQQQRGLLIGPYRSIELTEQQVMELAEQINVLPRQVQYLKRVYAEVPVLEEDDALFVMLDVFGEKIWGGSEKFIIVNIEQESQGTDAPFFFSTERMNSPEQTLWNMQTMERRYAHENELIQAVTQGQIHRAERLLSFFSNASFEQRLSDTVRNMKNYGIIMNTLLRKAAENGGVHPVYLDTVSSDFAKRIEAINNETDVRNMMADMLKAYCRLVRKNSIQKYSPPVQKAIAYIDSDLTADLSLRALAAMQNVSAGYLSALFRQETGQTLTEHVNQKRIKRAMQLLKTTKLQIQTIAQHCGIVDVHYFSKLFKKQVGKTPKEYRETP